MEKSGVKTMYAVEKYEIERKGDASYTATWRDQLHRLLPLTTLAAMAANLLYLTFRIRYTIDSQSADHMVYPAAWVFMAIETAMSWGSPATPVYLFRLLQCFLVTRHHRPRLHLVGERVPRVDVLITCAGEAVAIISDTVKAAADVDWPRDRLRIVVLDDMDSMEVRREVKRLALMNPSIHYTARKKAPGLPHHFKAGNLNHGLNYVEGIQGEKAEYVAALDADMIVERRWLRAVLPHLVIDSNMALASPSQAFYNVPKNDPLYQNMTLFFSTLECAKEAIGVAWCTGSGYVARRSALDQIGGFPVGSIAEDVYCSNLLIAAGWRTCYLREDLQTGTVPESFSSHIKQRTRWNTGTLQTSAKLNFFLFGQACREMGCVQRVCGLIFTLTTISVIFVPSTLLLFPILLAFDWRLIAYANSDQLRRLLRLAFFALFTRRLNEWIAYLPAGYRLAWNGNVAELWMAPYSAVAIVRSFLLPRCLGRKIANFSSSGSVGSTLEERNIHSRAPLLRRLRIICWEEGAFIHVLYVLSALVVAATSLARAFTSSMPSDLEHRLIYILTHVGWPPLYWLVAMVAYSTPIRYAISPPAMPNREILLHRDKKMGIAHPRLVAKRPRWGLTDVLSQGLSAAITVYTTTLFLGSWFV